jgi:hypothetical protein
LSDDSKKTNPADALKNKLGAGKPGALPGLGGKPGGAALPGLGGKPGAAALPGLGGKPGGAALPGLGGKPGGAAVPPFMQQAEPEPQAPDGRDPFNEAPPRRPSYRPSYAPDEGLIGESTDKSVSFSQADAGLSNKPLIIGAALIALVCSLVGYLGGKAYSGRVELNIAIRDARIVEYEIQKAAGLFDEVQAVLGTALNKANKREYDKNHLGYLMDKVKGNPVVQTVFTERNYKKFDIAAVQWLVDYNMKWAKLDKLIQGHRRQTQNDEKPLKATGEEFRKLLTTNFGVVFSRDSKAGNAFTANLVVIGAPVEGEDDIPLVQVQADTGTYPDPREVYNPEPKDTRLTEEPEKYVVSVGAQSKGGLLKNATQSHFEKYHARVKEMTDLMKSMTELQQNLLNQLSKISSQEPVGILGGIDVEEEVSRYKSQDKASSGMPVE